MELSMYHSVEARAVLIEAEIILQS